MLEILFWVAKLWLCQFLILGWELKIVQKPLQDGCRNTCWIRTCFFTDFEWILEGPELEKTLKSVVQSSNFVIFGVISPRRIRTGKSSIVDHFYTHFGSKSRSKWRSKKWLKKWVPPRSDFYRFWTGNGIKMELKRIGSLWTVRKYFVYAQFVWRSKMIWMLILRSKAKFERFWFSPGLVLRRFLMDLGWIWDNFWNSFCRIRIAFLSLILVSTTHGFASISGRF